MRTSYLNRIIGVLGTLLVLLAFSACNPQNEAPGEATLTVSVEDATSKLIGPDADNVDISHYRITVSNDNGAIAVSDLLPKNNAYTLTGLVPGEWDILAEGYVKPDASTEAVRVAGKSESTQLTAGSNPVKITLDKLDETPAGTVSITLLLPPEAVSGGSFQYWYSVVDMAGEEAMSSGSEMAPLTGTCTENTGTFDITGINQGSYLLFVSVNTSEGVVTAVDAMRLIAGLDAVGTLDFSGSSNTPTLDTGLTVEDAIGNILVFGDLDGTVFNITGADLELGLPNAYEYHWYLDGSEWDGYVSETEKGESETTFAVGNLEGISATRHVLSVVAVIPGTQIGVGSVELIVNKVGLTTVKVPEILKRHGKVRMNTCYMYAPNGSLEELGIHDIYAICDYIEASSGSVLCFAFYDSEGVNITEEAYDANSDSESLCTIICDGEYMIPIAYNEDFFSDEFGEIGSAFDFDFSEIDVFNSEVSQKLPLYDDLKYEYFYDNSSFNDKPGLCFYAAEVELNRETKTIHVSSNYSNPIEYFDLITEHSFQNWVPDEPHKTQYSDGKIHCWITEGNAEENVLVLYAITERPFEEDLLYRDHNSILYDLSADNLMDYIFPDDGIYISSEDYGKSLEMISVRLDENGSIKEASPLSVFYINDTGTVITANDRVEINNH